MMNKQIKKKKAKQALKHGHEQIHQELDKFDFQTLQIAFYEIGKVFRTTSKSLEFIIDSLRYGLELILDEMQQEGFSEKIGQQRTSEIRRRTFQIQQPRSFNQIKARRIDNKRPRQFFKRRT